MTSLISLKKNKFYIISNKYSLLVHVSNISLNILHINSISARWLLLLQWFITQFLPAEEKFCHWMIWRLCVCQDYPILFWLDCHNSCVHSNLNRLYSIFELAGKFENLFNFYNFNFYNFFEREHWYGENYFVLIYCNIQVKHYLCFLWSL